MQRVHERLQQGFRRNASNQRTNHRTAHFFAARQGVTKIVLALGRSLRALNRFALVPGLAATELFGCSYTSWLLHRMNPLPAIHVLVTCTSVATHSKRATAGGRT